MEKDKWQNYILISLKLMSKAFVKWLPEYNYDTQVSSCGDGTPTCDVGMELPHEPHERMVIVMCCTLLLIPLDSR